MEKPKLKPIDALAQKKEARPTTPGYHKYPPDMRYRLLPGLCKSNVLSKLNEDINNLTRIIKTQKPLTLKSTKYHSFSTTRKPSIKVKETVEQYLSSIDIGLLDTPQVSAKTIEDVLTLIGAKDEREGLSVMYQALLFVEIYINRVIEYGLITFYNGSKLNANKPISHYVESDFNVITELAQEYLHLASVKQKQEKTATCEGSMENIRDELKKKYNDLVKRFDTLNSTSAINTAKMEISDMNSIKLKEEIERLKAEIDKENKLREECLRTIKEKEIEINSLVDEINMIKASRDSYCLYLTRYRKGSNADSFEDILKIELQTMRGAFEKKIALLKSIISQTNEQHRIEIASKEKEIGELKEANEILYRRFNHLTEKK